MPRDLATESIVSAALNEAVKAVVDKLKEGKRLKIEDFLLLYLGTIAEELRAMRAEAADRDKSMRGEMAEGDKAIREEMARLRAEIGEVNKRIDETNKRIDAMAERIDKRIDDLYKFLARRSAGGS